MCSQLPDMCPHGWGHMGRRWGHIATLTKAQGVKALGFLLSGV